MTTTTTRRPGSRTTRGAAALLALPALGGCDPYFGVRLQQRLAPDTATACVRTALAASPLVAGIEDFPTHDAPPIHVLTLRDSARVFVTHDVDAKRGRTPGLVRIDYRRAPESLRGEERARLLAAGAELLDTVRDACAPATDSPVECLHVSSVPGRRERACPATPG